MPEDGSPRPRRIRRTLIAIARAAGLLILIVGINGVLGIAAPRLETLPREVISLLAGVIIFEILRPGRRRTEAVVLPPATDDSAAELVEARSIIDGLRAELQHTRDDSMEREAALRHDSEELTGINERVRREIAGLTEAVAQERASAEEARTREARVRQQFEAENEHLQRAAGRALEEIQQARAAADELRGQLEREGRRATEALQQLETVRKADGEKLGAASREIEKLRADSQRERQRADQALRELQNALSSAAGVATQRQKLEAQIADFDRRLAAAMQELDASRSERRRMETAAAARLEETVNKLTIAHEAAVAEAVAARDAARAEIQSLTGALQSERQHAVEVAAHRGALEEEMASLRASAVDEKTLRQSIETEWSAKLRKIENDLGEARSLSSRVEQLDRENTSLKAQAVDEKALRESLDGQWSAKLQKIVTELATDHENDLGEAIATREAAKAEARSMTSRLQELQKENAALKGRLANTSAVDEKALRETIDNQWSTRLQTIVNHMASDHEADVGKTIEEREAARAEARNLSMKVNSLQTKLRAAEEQIASLRNAPPPEAEPAIDEVRARAEVLQFAEQANAAIRRATSSGDVPLPPPERRARVLFVHHDPAMRNLWRDNLEKSGFDVQIAADGLEGLRLTMAGKPDVVIADSSMPKMDGRELCHLIKSNQEIAGVKVVLMTGAYTDEVPSEADELLRKPVKLETLKAALSNLLQTV